MWSYLSRNSDKKKYPWQERKSSSNVCATSLESFKKQNTATNISTISSGESSWTRFMLSIQRATQPLSENKQNIGWMWKQKPLCYEYKYKSIYIDTIKRVYLQAAKMKLPQSIIKQARWGKLYKLAQVATILTCI